MRPQPLQTTAAQENRRVIRRALVLVGLLAIPVIGLMLLQAGVVVACDTRVTANGVAQGQLQWRVTQMSCRHAAPYYDVAIGAKGMTLSTALTSQGAPIPTAVSRLDDRTVRVSLDRARVADGATHVDVKLRRSGSPAERIDLQADVSP
jgi:hypothetical protein